MTKNAWDSRTLALVRIPFAQDSVDYRAYAERLHRGSVLDWALSRFVAAVAAPCPLLCVCASDQERGRLQCAYTGGRVTFLSRTTASEVHQVRQLMDEYQASRLVSFRLEHAILPVSRLWHTLETFHATLAATLIGAVAPALDIGAYVVDTPAVDVLLATDAPDAPKELLHAAWRPRTSRWELSHKAVTARWFRLQLGDLLDLGADLWPESIRLTSARDVDVLREAVRSHGASSNERPHYLDAWKAASVDVTRAERARDAAAITKGRTRRAVASPRRVRVLYISASSYFHGASQSLCHLVEGLDARRYEAFAVVPFVGVLTDELERRGVRVICPNQDIKSVNATGVRLASRVLREAGPDIAHGNYAIGTPLVAALVGANVPIVQHVRIAAFKTLLLEIHCATVVVAVSEMIKRQLTAFDMDRERVTVIWDGIDTNDFMPDPSRQSLARQALRIPDEEFIVATIGRMSRQKRHEAVVAAVGQLRRLTGRGHLLLAAALDNDRAYYDEILKHVRQEGLADHFTHIEFTRDVPTILHASDSLALMSKNEALGRVVLEAMAVGRPVVVGDSSGAVELIEDGVNGFVVPYTDTAALASRLNELLDDRARARKMGEAAARTIQARASSEHCAAQTMAIYERVLSERGAAAYTDEQPIVNI